MQVNWKIVGAVALGFVVLLPATMLHAWTGPYFPSIKPWPNGTENQGPYRPTVDEWKWELLNKWYGNSEDGVSGAQAWVWASINVTDTLVPYYSTFPSWVPQWAMAYCWSAWRNNANNLKRPLRGDSLTGTVP